MNKRGQITIEYFLVMAVVIVTILFFARPDGSMHQSMNAVSEIQANQIQTMADRIFN